ncbi:hypothetical protein Athai_25670 [Actinocatenispora thailandica]|uniref:Uncharacterized protein n=1 Tax=Actinocatenispora thailandica TaxID=227318 RepID=A0A7R7DNL7_9ACTN|nr:hypothetical protein [Actinocatenispora thailandica]BCJ35064.1 hypothetical protein Athai_25670 [Actinocatenispora thailandica]
MSVPPAGPTPPGYDPTGAAPPSSRPDPAGRDLARRDSAGRDSAPSDPVEPWQPTPPTGEPGAGPDRPAVDRPAPDDHGAAPAWNPYASRSQWADGRVAEGDAPPPSWQPAPRAPRRGWPVLLGVGATCMLFVLAGLVIAGLLVTRAGRKPGATGHDVDHGPLRQSNYHDWHFRLDQVKLDATKTGGRNLDSCAPVEHDRALSAQGCRSGIELDYRTAGDRVRMEQLVLMFDTAAHAKRAGRGLAGSQLALRRSKLHPHVEGAMVQQVTDQYLVITVGTAAKATDDDRRDTFVHYANADMAAAMLWRD